MHALICIVWISSVSYSGHGGGGGEEGRGAGRALGEPSVDSGQ